ncbi:MAG: hypothetical protein U0736_15995 [Gemmataceae bacterium]
MLMGEFLTAVKERPADHRGGGEERHARADQVGADAVPGQPGVRVRAAGVRLRALRRGVRRGRLPAPASRARSGRQLEQALAADRPALVEVPVDANEPLPVPSLSAAQSLHLAEALARGTPNGSRDRG